MPPRKPANLPSQVFDQIGLWSQPASIGTYRKLLLSQYDQKPKLHGIFPLVFRAGLPSFTLLIQNTRFIPVVPSSKNTFLNLVSNKQVCEFFFWINLQESS